ncbi:hypothetical protein Plec18170_006508 [Paecilomyces lecythidis]
MGEQLQHTSDFGHRLNPSQDEAFGSQPTLAGVEATGHNASPAEQIEPEVLEKPAAGPGPVPNGGLVAWLHVLGGFILFFNTWGILNAFGVFQTYYESGALFHKTSSDISWIGSIQSYMLLTVSFFSGPIYDRGYLRSLLVVGSFGIVFGHMMLSLCKEYWQVLLAQGFCVGIGAGCLFVPCVALLPTYFSTKLGLAVGLAASGSSLGGVIYPIVLFRLIDRIGFGWSVRVLGFIALGTLLIPIAIMRMRVKAPKARALIDWSAFTDVSYMTFVLSTLVGFMGLFVILFYISYYTEDQRITDTTMAFYIIPIFNAASCFGRTLPNSLADKTGPFNLVAPGAIGTGVLILCMMAVKSEAAIIVVAILTGFLSGVFIAMPPLCFVALTKDKTKIGTRIGMGYGMIGFGVLAGGPGGGAILGNTDPLNWNGIWIFGGVTACVAGVIFNENLRLAERRVPFDVDALAKVVCSSIDRPLSSLISITKLAEGGFNRILQGTFDDGYQVLARIPYHTTVPRRLAVASEAATLDLLSSHDIPVPKVLGYSPDRTNPVGTEYLLLEKLEGVPLSEQWFTMDNKTRVKIMRQIVDIEKRVMSIPLPASGSIYYRCDLKSSGSAISITTEPFPTRDGFAIGPSSQLEWWYRERALLDVDRGPCIPKHFQNWGDPLSESLAKPEVQLPEHFHGLSKDEQEAVKETMRRRLVHFYYAGLTMREIPDHFEALMNENAMLRAKLFDRAGAPWEGDSASLQYVLLQVYQNWPVHLDGVPSAKSIKCPIDFSDEEIREITNRYDQKQEKMTELEEMREVVGIDALGWLPDDEQLEKSKTIAQKIKEDFLEHSTTEEERIAVEEHFPFDDHEEDV